MSAVDIGEIIFLVIIILLGVGGMIKVLFIDKNK